MNTRESTGKFGTISEQEVFYKIVIMQATGDLSVNARVAHSQVTYGRREIKIVKKQRVAIVVM
jgi:hypothetical protein